MTKNASVDGPQITITIAAKSCVITTNDYSGFLQQGYCLICGASGWIGGVERAGFPHSQKRENCGVDLYHSEACKLNDILTWNGGFIK